MFVSMKLPPWLHINSCCLIVLLVAMLNWGLESLSSENLKYWNGLDIIICLNLTYPFNSLMRNAFSLAIFDLKMCCSECTTDSNFHGPTTSIIWLLNTIGDDEQILKESVASILLCIQRERTSQPLFHFVFTSSVSFSSEYNFVISLLKKELGPVLMYPHELFVCQYAPSLIKAIRNCSEIYQIKSEIVSQTIKFETAITELATRRTNLFQVTLAAVATEIPGFSKRFKPKIKPDDPLVFIGGSNVDIYRYLRDSLNFTEKAVRSNESMTRNPEDGFLKNSGIVGSLNSGESDFSIGQYEFVPYRMGGPYGIRYLHAAISSKKGLAIFVQPRNHGAINVYTGPFTDSVWLSYFVIAFIIFILFLKCFIILAGLSPSISTCKAIWYTISILTLKGNLQYISPLTISVRLLILCSLMTTLILQSAYTSILTSISTTDDDPIKDFHQLIPAGYKFAINKNTPALIPLIAEYTDEKSQEVTIDAVFPEVLHSRTVLVTTSSEFRTFLPAIYKEDFLCRTLSFLTISRISIKDAHLVRQGTPFKNLFNIKLLQMFQTGIEQRTRKDHIEQMYLRCPVDKPIIFYPMTKEDVYFPFVLFFIMIVASISIFIIEHLKSQH